MRGQQRAIQTEMMQLMARTRLARSLQLDVHEPSSPRGGPTVLTGSPVKDLVHTYIQSYTHTYLYVCAYAFLYSYIDARVYMYICKIHKHDVKLMCILPRSIRHPVGDTALVSKSQPRPSERRRNHVALTRQRLRMNPSHGSKLPKYRVCNQVCRVSLLGIVNTVLGTYRIYEYLDPLGLFIKSPSSGLG